ncbi:MAG: hypothetical protein ACKVVT_12595, partial [Dehalococcoidia bacterium]
FFLLAMEQTSPRLERRVVTSIEYQPRFDAAAFRVAAPAGVTPTTPSAAPPDRRPALDAAGVPVKPGFYGFAVAHPRLHPIGFLRGAFQPTPSHDFNLWDPRRPPLSSPKPDVIVTQRLDADAAPIEGAPAQPLSDGRATWWDDGSPVRTLTFTGGGVVVRLSSETLTEPELREIAERLQLTPR